MTNKEAQSPLSRAAARNANWRDKTIYQIYPMSFADSNGDGMGDIPGIISKLDYLAELGVGYLWLTPVYPSPGNDNGYDISDYRDVDPKFGTLADLEELFAEAHARNIGVIMDMVVNHTSTEHRWFQEALRDPTGPYRDYYIWRRGKGEHGEEPPNNWASKFSGSAWAQDPAHPESGEWYLHLYDRTQADLNWENPRVRAEVIDICRFWAERGIDGFRLDVINNISKDQRFPDDTYETPSHDGRTYYSDGPRAHEFLHLLHEEVFEPYGLITVGEMSSTTTEQCVLYTRPDRGELSMTFSFHHMKVDYPGGAKWARADYDLRDLKHTIATWQQEMIAGEGWNALFWTNHDQPRATSRFLSDAEDVRELCAKTLAITEFGLCGTTYIYQGEELAMRNPGFTAIEQFEDTETVNAYRALMEGGVGANEALACVVEKSRDNCRVPMVWDERAPHGGFSTVDPWFSAPVSTGCAYATSARYAVTNVDSVWHTYQRLIRLRHELPIFTDGSFELLDANSERVFAYERRLKKSGHEERLLVAANFSGEETTFTWPQGDWTVLESTHGRCVVPESLEPYEAIMLHIG